MFIELPGGRTQGVILLVMFPEGPPAIGSEIEVVIDGVDADGLLRLSRMGAAVQANWSTLMVGQVVEARVTDTNTGGLAVDVDGIRGFLPISQIDLYRVEDTKQFIGQKLLCMITEADKDDNNLVLSRRALLEKQREDQREKTWAQLEVGQIYDGIVRSIKDFGAFVDIGGVDGLVHVSDMSWERKQNAADLVKVGQKVKVEVLRLDPEKRKVSLGMKQLTASPWDEAAIKYPIGGTVSGKVTRTAEFGAFVELEPAIEGLIHISELATQRVRRVTDIVKVDQMVEVVVLAVDTEQRAFRCLSRRRCRRWPNRPPKRRTRSRRCRSSRSGRGRRLCEAATPTRGRCFLRSKPDYSRRRTGRLRGCESIPRWSLRSDRRPACRRACDRRAACRYDLRCRTIPSHPLGVCEPNQAGERRSTSRTRWTVHDFRNLSLARVW